MATGTMIDCGRYEFRTWSEGLRYTCRWLGPFNPDMPLEEVHRRLENEKLTDEAVKLFEVGWNAQKTEWQHSQLKKDR